MLKCFSLAQADAEFTTEIIEIDGYPFERVVEMLSSAEYRDALSTDSCLMEFDSLIRESYRVAIEKKFVFKRDLYGGYGLFYVGEDQINAQSDQLRSIKISAISGWVCRKNTT